MLLGRLGETEEASGGAGGSPLRQLQVIAVCGDTYEE